MDLRTGNRNEDHRYNSDRTRVRDAQFPDDIWGCLAVSVRRYNCQFTLQVSDNRK